MITRIYEFLELEKSYPYEFVKNNSYMYTYQFESDDDIYMIDITIMGGSVVTFEWCNKEDYYNPNRKDFIDEKTNPNYNISTVYKILNTIFKILFDFMEEKSIDEAVIGSCNKSKYKTYKRIIQEEPTCRITNVDRVYADKKQKLHYSLQFTKTDIKKPWNPDDYYRH